MPNFVYNPPMSPYLDIIHQDQDIVVLNKPSGLLSVPGRDSWHKDSLALTNFTSLARCLCGSPIRYGNLRNHYFSVKKISTKSYGTSIPTKSN